MWWTLLGTIILVVTLLVKSPVKVRSYVMLRPERPNELIHWFCSGHQIQNTASFVFTDLENFTGWENKGFVVLLGFLQAVYTLEGAETSAQGETSSACWLVELRKLMLMCAHQSRKRRTTQNGSRLLGSQRPSSAHGSSASSISSRSSSHFNLSRPSNRPRMLYRLRSCTMMRWGRSSRCCVYSWWGRVSF